MHSIFQHDGEIGYWDIPSLKRGEPTLQRRLVSAPPTFAGNGAAL